MGLTSHPENMKIALRVKVSTVSTQLFLGQRTQSDMGLTSHPENMKIALRVKVSTVSTQLFLGQRKQRNLCVLDLAACCSLWTASILRCAGEFVASREELER